MNLFTVLPAVARKSVLLAILLILTATYANAQERNVEFSSRHISIERALAEIESQTKYLVSINHTDFDISRKVRLSSESLPLRTALDQLFAKTERTYMITNNYILIMPQKRSPENASVITAADTISNEWKNIVKQMEILKDYPDVGVIPGKVLKSPEDYSEYPEISFGTHHFMARSAVAKTNYLRTPVRWAIKTNLLYGAAALAPNLGLEIGLGKRSTLDLTVGYNGWKVDGTEKDNKKLAHLIGRGEYRYWLCERFNGHFFGAHAFFGRYNISEYKIPLLLESGAKDYRYQGNIIGAGISYGYQWMLGKHWNLEGNIGVGYGYMKYDKYMAPKCGEKVESDATRNYFGPTRVGISLVYIIK